MSTMSKTKNLRTANREIRECMAVEIANTGRATTCYLLKKDGNTYEYYTYCGKIKVRELAGHITLGMVVDHLPCIVA